MVSPGKLLLCRLFPTVMFAAGYAVCRLCGISISDIITESGLKWCSIYMIFSVSGGLLSIQWSSRRLIHTTQCFIVSTFGVVQTILECVGLAMTWDVDEIQGALFFRILLISTVTFRLAQYSCAFLLSFSVLRLTAIISEEALHPPTSWEADRLKSEPYIQKSILSSHVEVRSDETLKLSHFHNGKNGLISHDIGILSATERGECLDYEDNLMLLQNNNDTARTAVNIECQMESFDFTRLNEKLMSMAIDSHRHLQNINMQCSSQIQNLTNDNFLAPSASSALCLTINPSLSRNGVENAITSQISPEVLKSCQTIMRNDLQSSTSSNDNNLRFYINNIKNNSSDTGNTTCFNKHMKSNICNTPPNPNTNITLQLDEMVRSQQSPNPNVSTSSSTACCPICLSDFEDGDLISCLPCQGSHMFHSTCISPWLAAPPPPSPPPHEGANLLPRRTRQSSENDRISTLTSSSANQQQLRGFAAFFLSLAPPAPRALASPLPPTFGSNNNNKKGSCPMCCESLLPLLLAEENEDFEPTLSSAKIVLLNIVSPWIPFREARIRNSCQENRDEELENSTCNRERDDLKESLLVLEGEMNGIRRLTVLAGPRDSA